VVNFDVATFIEVMERASSSTCSRMTKQMTHTRATLARLTLHQARVAVEDQGVPTPLHIDVPYIEQGFEGVVQLQGRKAETLFFDPSRAAIVQLSAPPFFVIPLDDILLVWFSGEYIQ
jgi:nucleosome binding factor SPN SPT16 subunit